MLKRSLFSLFFVLLAGYPSWAQESESSYSSNYKMREARKVGVGFLSGSSTGLLGVVLDLNFEDADGATVSVGQGDGYRTFAIAWKHNFEGEYLNVYSTVGWSRWYASGSQVPQSYILDAVLPSNEIRSSQIGVDFISAAIGAQYNQLEGDLQGFAFFGQIELLYAPFAGGTAPAAGLGSVYYF